MFRNPAFACEQAAYRIGLVLGSVFYTGKDITEELDAVNLHVRICRRAAR